MDDEDIIQSSSADSQEQPQLADSSLQRRNIRPGMGGKKANTSELA